MPIFEFICKNCQHQFEVIVRGNNKPECPSCASRKLEKQLSVFSAASRDAHFDGAPSTASACGSCGDPRGPGSCSLN